jgi:hypothetical protein
MKNIRELGNFTIILAVALFVAADPAFALTNASAGMSGGSSCTDGTLGGVICNTISSSELVPGVFTGLSYLFGLLLGVVAIFKLREHVESPSQVPIWDPVKRFLAGGSFFALPTLIRATMETLDKGGSIDAYSNTGFQGQSSGSGLDAMMVKLIGDIWEPMLAIILAFGYLAGIIFVMIGISRFLKSEQEGARGPTGIGTIMTFLVAGAMFSLHKMVGALSSSLFDTNVVTTKGELVYTAGMNGTEVAHVEAVIAAVIGFVALLGWISIVRGFFIVRGVSEGNSQASMMAGMTHLLGGALAVNLGPVISAVQTTLGITDYGIAFS